MINVTKSFMPPYEEYEAYLKKLGIWIYKDYSLNYCYEKR